MLFGYHACALVDLLGQGTALGKLESDLTSPVEREKLEAGLRETAGRVIAFRRHLDRLGQRGYPTIILNEFVRVGADETMLANKDWLEDALDPFREGGLQATVLPDEEHNLFKIVPGENLNGHRWVKPIGRDFMAAAEYRTLVELYNAVEPFDHPPLIVVDSNGGENAAPQEKECANKEDLVDYLLTAGKKGLQIQRYKGLGEMNPSQLWDTTMDPEVRVLMRVNIDDEVEADQIFTVLMGDQVEPRKFFIETNALNVSNLDV